MYGTHGYIREAEHVFNGLSRHDVVSWNSVICMYVGVGEVGKALQHYKHMLEEGCCPSAQIYVTILQACGVAFQFYQAKVLLLDVGRALHAEALRNGFAPNIFICSTLVSFYGKCGSILEAENVFNGLLEPNIVCWTAMLSAYLEHGQGEVALQLYKQMQDDGVIPDKLTFMTILQACQVISQKEVASAQEVPTNVMCMEIGQALHADARRRNFALDVHVANTLVTLYGKLHSILEAENAFNALSVCDTASWNSMLLVYVEQGYGEKALQLYMKMQEEGLVPNSQTFIAILQAVHDLQREKDALFESKEEMESVPLFETLGAIHADVFRNGLACDSYVASTIVTLYGTLGRIVEAENAFEKLSQQSVVEWNALLSAYTKQYPSGKALHLYRQMQEHGVAPNGQTFVFTLQACCDLVGKEKTACDQGFPVEGMSLVIGRALHGDAWKLGLVSDVFVLNTLVVMYGKGGSIVEAEHVFDGLLERNAVSWNALLSAYVGQGQGRLAFQVLRLMHEEGMSPILPTYMIMFQSCSDLPSREDVCGSEQGMSREMLLNLGRALHADCSSRGFTTHISIGSALVSMYGKCGTVSEAENAFDKLLMHNVRSWSAMLSAYVEQGEGKKALWLYTQMHKEACSPNQLTVAFALHACGLLFEKQEDVNAGKLVELVCLEIGKAVLDDLRKKAFTLDAFVGNNLMKLYSKCGTVVEAENVFDLLRNRDLVSWNTMLSAYTENGQGEKTLLLYRQMHEEGLHPNQQTFMITIQATTSLLGKLESVNEEELSGNIWLYNIGKALHVDAWRDGFSFDAFIGSTLVTFYGKSGSVVDAEDVFILLVDHNIVLWNAMLSVYVEQGQGEKGLLLYKHMLTEGVSVDDITLTCLLHACSGTGNLEVCMQIHFSIMFAGYDRDSFLMNTLIRAYGSCASMGDAQATFDNLLQLDEVSWSSCIAGYTQLGKSIQSLELVKEMQATGIAPIGPTFLTLLSACSHASLVSEGIQCFEAMTSCGVTPNLKHFAAMVDLFGRVGDFKRVEVMLLSMPLQASLVVWSCLLGACYVHRNGELGAKIFFLASNLKTNDAAPFVIMSNIYAEAGEGPFG